MSKKIVVLIINTLKGGGAERSVLTLAKGFCDLGYRTHIIYFKSKIEYELIDGIKYHHVSIKAFNIVPKVIRDKVISGYIDRFILKNIGIPNIILSNLERADKIMAHSKLNNVNYIIRNNVSIKYDLANDKSSKTKNCLIGIYSKHRCICVSKGVEEDLRSILNNHIQVTTIYNSFDQSYIIKESNKPLPETLPQKVRNLIESGEYIINVGSFTSQKAHDVLLKAYAKSNKKYPLLLLGQGSLEYKCRDLVKALNLENFVYFLGFQSNPYPIIKNAKALVLSSIYEGFVRVVVEALALNVSAISTDCPYGPNEILPSSNLVPVNDINALAAKFDECTNNPDNFYVEFNSQLLPINIAKQYEDLISI